MKNRGLCQSVASTSGRWLVSSGRNTTGRDWALVPLNNKPDRINVKSVFLFKYSIGKGFDRIARSYINLFLQNYRPRIELFVHIMNSTAGYFFAGGQDAFVHGEAGIGGQQARMDVDDPIRKSLNERR